MATKPAVARLVEKDATSGICELVAKHLPSKKPLLLCDDFTWKAAGEKIHALLESKQPVTRHSFGKYIEAKLSLAESAIEIAKDHDAIIAVGSGTINDLAKYAAAKANKPYIAIATAASMNGYNSATASLDDGIRKRSYNAKPPRAVIADTTILAAAPKRMTRAGLGDTLCRSTVEADMIMSHHLLGTPYPAELFATMRAHEPWLITNAPLAREGDTTFTHKLMDALLDTGAAMATMGSSAPASQGEHMIAHTLEFMYGSELRNVLHGELIALTTLSMNRLQQKIMLGQPIVKRMPREAAQFELLFGKKFGANIAEHYSEKVLNTEQAHSINAKIEQQWGDIKTQILGIMQAPNTIERAFVQSGLAIKPTEIAINEERYRFACTYAFMTRERFTFLDIAAMNDKRAT